ncbi:MAG TPA: hypothetical protein VGM90_13365 [Kofleriaceae bacterium]|jgi:hypothetical protein
MKQKKAPQRLREKTPWAGLAVVALVLGATLGSAGANMIPMVRPTFDEKQQAQQAETSAARRQNLVALVIAGDQCKPALAREIAKQLVFDGQSARAYTNGFAKRCGEIDSVSRWGAIEPPIKATQRVHRHFAAL